MTMKTTLISSLLFVLPAQAWELPCNWTNDTTTAADEAGGGGLFATGGKRDFSVTCSACHLETLTTPPRGQIDTTLTFAPALGTAGTVRTFTPGQRYEVTVTLVGEYLGLASCGAAENINTFAATVEDATGATFGRIESDTGQSSAACLTGLSSMNCNGSLPATGGSTFMAGDCHAVAGYGAGRTTWKFYWTPPAATTVTDVTFFWGTVDGDCKMNSLKDDVKERTLVVRRAGAALQKATLPPWRIGREAPARARTTR